MQKIANCPDCPLLSIAIIAFNVATKIKNMMESVCQLQLKNVEILCIDDCSTDNSTEIIDEYAKKDRRIKKIYHEKNVGTHASRLEGMTIASGEYVWVIDGDDCIIPDAVNDVIEILNKRKYDIIHISTKVVDAGSYDSARVQSMQKFTKPYKGALKKDKIFSMCFINKEYGFNIWNKIFSRDLIRKTSTQFCKERLPKAQDEYEYFVLSSNANTYYGMPKTIAYEYHFGSGITGHNSISIEDYYKYCSMSNVANIISQYSIDKNSIIKRGSELCREQLINDNVKNWYRVPINDRQKAFDALIDSWGPSKTISAIAKTNWTHPELIAKSLNKHTETTDSIKKIKTVATYYHNIKNGGVQRVISSLMHIWKGLGHTLILITDDHPTEQEYPLPMGVRRYVIPHYDKTNKDNYEKRATQLYNIIKENQVDLLINHAWVSNTLLWDMLVCQYAGSRFIIHCHNVFPLLEGGGFSYFCALPHIYRLSDGIVTLSKVDYAFWSNFNLKTYWIHNPLTYGAQKIKASDLMTLNIIWVGRFSKEKRPLEAIKIYKMVQKHIPDSKLVMIGDGEMMKEVRNTIEQERLSSYVELTGFHTDITEYYQKGSVFLSTSEYEGYYLSLFEALTFGIPAVVYSMPYLTATRDGRGVIEIEQGDKVAATAEICKLLSNLDYRKTLGEEGREYMIQLTKYNYEATWDNILNLKENETPIPVSDEDVKIMWDTLFDFYKKGIDRKNRDISSIKNSASYKLGSKILSVPKKIMKK